MIHWMEAACRLAARRGAEMLLLCAGLGLVFPALAQVFHPWMSAGVFCFVFALVAKVHWRSVLIQCRRAPLRLLLVFASASLLVPVLVGGVCRLAGASDGLAIGMAMAAAAPPSGAGLVVLLGLDVSLAVAVMLVGSLLSVVITPFVLIGVLPGSVTVPVDVGLMAQRLALLTWCPALLATGLKWVFPQEFTGRALEISGLSNLGFAVLGLGAMQGMGTLLASEPILVMRYFAAACAFNFGLQSFGFAWAKAMGAPSPMSLAVSFGGRNFALVAAGASVYLAQHREASLFVSMAIESMFILPWVQCSVFSAVSRWSLMRFENQVQ